jgi:hypothetical protein
MSLLNLFWRNFMRCIDINLTHDHFKWWNLKIYDKEIRHEYDAARIKRFDQLF